MQKIKQAFIPRADDNAGQQQDQDLKDVKNLTGLGQHQRDDLNPEAQKELQQLRSTLQNNIQSSRMQHHAFEPLSLPGSQPASRVCTYYHCPALTNYR